MDLPRTCMVLLGISGAAGTIAAGFDASQGGIRLIGALACFTTILCCHVAMYAATSPQVTS